MAKTIDLGFNSVIRVNGTSASLCTFWGEHVVSTDYFCARWVLETIKVKQLGYAVGLQLLNLCNLDDLKDCRGYAKELGEYYWDLVDRSCFFVESFLDS